MKVLVDTNVVADFLATREPFYENSAKLMQRCASGELKGYIAFHSVPNLWYIFRKVPELKRREWLTDLCSILHVAGASHDEVLKAIQMDSFRDFEDCLQDRCAESVGAEYIVTRNREDFANSKVPAVLPEELLAMMG